MRVYGDYNTIPDSVVLNGNVRLNGEHNTIDDVPDVPLRAETDQYSEVVTEAGSGRNNVSNPRIQTAAGGSYHNAKDVQFHPVRDTNKLDRHYDNVATPYHIGTVSCYDVPPNNTQYITMHSQRITESNDDRPQTMDNNPPYTGLQDVETGDNAPDIGLQAASGGSSPDTGLQVTSGDSSLDTVLHAASSGEQIQGIDPTDTQRKTDENPYLELTSEYALPNDTML